MGLTTSVRKSNFVPILAQFGQFLEKERAYQEAKEKELATYETGNQIVKAFSKLGDNPSIEQINNASKYAIGLAMERGTPDALKVLEPLMSIGKSGYGAKQDQLLSNYLVSEYGDVIDGKNLAGLSGENALKAIQHYMSGLTKEQVTNPTGSTSVITYDRKGNKVKEIVTNPMTYDQKMKMELDMYGKKQSIETNYNIAQEKARMSAMASSGILDFQGTAYKDKNGKLVQEAKGRGLIYPDGTPYKGDGSDLTRIPSINPLSLENERESDLVNATRNMVEVLAMQDGDVKEWKQSIYKATKKSPTAPEYIAKAKELQRTGVLHKYYTVGLLDSDTYSTWFNLQYPDYKGKNSSTTTTKGKTTGVTW